MKLSENFELDEFLHSETASRLGRNIVPTQDIIDNLRELCVELLEPARIILDNRAIIPTSGYRPPWVNRLIGGSDDSDHMLGGAVDFKVRGLTPAEVCERIAASDLPFRQLILEFNAWTHIAKPRKGEEPKRQVFTAKRVATRTVYEVGIHP